ncbi:heterokaryon incompatibility protein-domain-containing protein [Diaporthe sp. PMI_573]|nr:heterokaryon incompatibility protein-domain-containing protein [Diaporthaceae sp. PMI_573]
MNTGSEISLNQTKEWMQMCQTHPHCSSEHDSVLPTRVLDIGDRSVKAIPQSSETYAKVEQYIALSHCWGNSPMIQTTSANIAERKRGIPFSEIPKTFQEASSLARHLGIRYLWVDSLCIVQDDKLDWQRESAQMASIYAKAALTIAANASQDSTGGCFRPTPQLSGTMEFRRTGAFNFRWIDAAILDRAHLEFAPDRGFVHPTKLPLASRAWAFQERLLSSRIVHFTASELVWECTSESYCQCGLTLKLAFDHAVREASVGNPEQIKDMWQKLVSNYTLKALTHKTDLLPAASGLMKRLQQANLGECLAGMWRKYLPEHMTWSVAAAKNEHARHETYVAPTWSWASVTAPVDFPTYIHAASTLILPTTLPKPLVVAEIIDVQCTPAGLDTTGSLSDGVLTIRAPAVPALLLSSQRGKFVHESPVSCNFVCEIYSPHNGAFARFHPDSYSDIDGSIERQDVLCVQWTKTMEECRALEWQETNAEFLVLRRSHKRPGKYERIGMVTVASHKRPDYRTTGKPTPMDKWFQGASIQTLELV